MKKTTGDIDALIERLREWPTDDDVEHGQFSKAGSLMEQAADALAKLQERLGCPPADQERDHLHEQCMTLLRENAKLREAVTCLSSSYGRNQNV